MSEKHIRINSNDYSISIDHISGELTLSGSMRLPVTDLNKKILPLLMEFIEKTSRNISINIVDLQFLNSIGISNILIIIMKIYKKNLPLKLHLSKNYPWQMKIRDNIKLANPDTEIKLHE